MKLPMRVWDGATRLFHWAIVITLVVSYVSIRSAGGANAALWMRVHLISGETSLALLLFRIIWGLIGSETARFGAFLRSPLTGLRHLATLARREPDTQVGHNPAGGWMVVVLLLAVAFQVGTGLFANDDGSTEGPLMQFVPKQTSDTLSKLHGIGFNILLGAVVLHVVAIVAYGVLKRQDLVRPMITGKKRLPAATRQPRMASQMLAALTLAVAAGVAVLVSRL